MKECRDESEIYNYQRIQLLNNKFINGILVEGGGRRGGGYAWPGLIVKHQYMQNIFWLAQLVSSDIKAHLFKSPPKPLTQIHRRLIIGGLQCWKFLLLFLHHWEITMEMITLVTLHLVSIFSLYLQALIQSKLIGIYLGFFASIKNILKKYWIPMANLLPRKPSSSS